MLLEEELKEKTIEAVNALFDAEVIADQITFQKTRKEFEGDITLVVFSLTRVSKKKPEETAEAIGAYLNEHIDTINGYNVVKGFLNLVISDSHWLSWFSTMQTARCW